MLKETNPGPERISSLSETPPILFPFPGASSLLLCLPNRLYHLSAPLPPLPSPTCSINSLHRSPSLISGTLGLSGNRLGTYTHPAASARQTTPEKEPRRATGANIPAQPSAP